MQMTIRTGKPKCPACGDTDVAEIGCLECDDGEVGGEACDVCGGLGYYYECYICGEVFDP